MEHHKKTKVAVALAFALCLGACTASDIPLLGDSPDRKITIADVPDRDEVVGGDTDSAIIHLDLKDALRARRLTASEQLPGHIMVPTTNLDGVPVTAALQAVLSGTDISLSWNSGALGSRLVTVMNLRGPLPRVVERICSAARVFCAYRHGSIELSEEETFVVSLPPVVRAIGSTTISGASAFSSASSSLASDVTNTMVDAIDRLLGDQKSTVDKQGGTILYTATVDVHEQVSRYLSELRTERPLIVLQMYIWEVTLNRENAQGINWTKFENTSLKSQSFSLNSNLSSLANDTGSIGFGAVTTGIISIDAVASFVASKGRVQTISNPQLTFVSGSTASLMVGGTQKYISQVGTTSTNTSGTTTSSSTNTISTEEIQTGLAVNVAGSYENGVIFANLDMTLRSLISLNPTQSGGLTVDLPETTDERINTVLRVRPGDSLVLAGLVSSSMTGDNEGVPLGEDSALPLFGKETRANRELVIIVKPTIILFSDKSTEAQALAEGRLGGLPETIVIDKNGSRPMSGTKRRRVYAPTRGASPFGGSSAPVESGLTLEASDDAPIYNGSVGGSGGSVPVSDGGNVNTGQGGGFSSAFDKLFQGTSSPETEQGDEQ